LAAAAARIPLLQHTAAHHNTLQSTDSQDTLKQREMAGPRETSEAATATYEAATYETATNETAASRHTLPAHTHTATHGNTRQHTATHGSTE